MEKVFLFIHNLYHIHKIFKTVYIIEQFLKKKNFGIDFHWDNLELSHKTQMLKAWKILQRTSSRAIALQYFFCIKPPIDSPNAEGHAPQST